MLNSYNVDAQVEMVGDDMVVMVKQGEGNIALLCLNLQRFKVFNKEAHHQVYTLVKTYLGHLNLIWHQFNSFRRIPYLLFMMYSSRYTLYSHHCFKVWKTRLGGSTNKEDASVIQGYKYSGDV